MVRTQIYLPQEIHEELHRRGKALRMSIAEQIRRAIALYLKIEEEPTLDEDDPIWNIIGRVESERGDLSERHDEYLYGVER
jgi:hypothetical protein